MDKKRAYEQRIREVEHASFTPLVMSATGGLAKEATNFYKRLASPLTDVRVDVLTEEKDKSTTYVELTIQLIIIKLHRTANSTQTCDTT